MVNANVPFGVTNEVDASSTASQRKRTKLVPTPVDGEAGGTRTPVNGTVDSVLHNQQLQSRRDVEVGEQRLVNNRPQMFLKAIGLRVDVDRGGASGLDEADVNIAVLAAKRRVEEKVGKVKGVDKGDGIGADDCKGSVDNVLDPLALALGEVPLGEE